MEKIITQALYGTRTIITKGRKNYVWIGSKLSKREWSRIFILGFLYWLSATLWYISFSS